MAAAKPFVVVIIAFLLVAAAAIPLPDGGGKLPYMFPPAEPPSVVSLPNAGGKLPYTLAPAEPPSVPFPDSGLPFTVLSADPAAAGCHGPVGVCPARKEVPPGLGAGGGASTMSADAEQVRRRVHHQQRDSVPCSRRGASYYNCRAQDSPYRRACSRIKHCHG